MAEIKRTEPYEQTSDFRTNGVTLTDNRDSECTLVETRILVSGVLHRGLIR